MFSDLRASRELAWRLFVRDISAQYRATIFGYVWAVLPPLITSLVFILLNSSNVVNMQETEVPYPAYVMMGTVFFSLFADSLTAPLKLVTASKVMLARINFPREALLLSAMAQVVFGFGIKLLLLTVTMVVFSVSVKWTAILAVIPLAGLLLMGTMIGILLVPPGLLFQDISYSLAVVTNGLMFLTPVVYPPPQHGLLAAIVNANPLTPLIVSAKDFVTVGFGPYTQMMVLVIVATVFVLFVGWVVFRIALPVLIERVGA
jgi:lipopolysaccharide transport system permease protein